MSPPILMESEKNCREPEDVLRLQLNPGSVDLAGLVVEGDLGRALADTVIGPVDP
ncbi:MAG: hypothetical protein ACKVHR_17130 [Pirellulales bacterium]